VANEIVAAVRILSRHRFGSIILVDPTGSVDGGVVLDARVRRELLVAIAIPERVNELHRGAVLIRGDLIERAAVPFTWEEVVERVAACAIAIAIDVDVNTGEIRFVDRTYEVALVDADELAIALARHRR
jgi:hypothetical protein